MSHTQGVFQSRVNGAGTHTSATGGLPGGNNDVHGIAPGITLPQSSCFISEGLLSPAGFQAWISDLSAAPNASFDKHGWASASSPWVTALLWQACCPMAGWSLVIPVCFRHLSLVSRVGQRCFTKICRFCLLLTQGCPVRIDSAGCWGKRGSLWVGCVYNGRGRGGFMGALGKALLGRQDMIWAGCSVELPQGGLTGKCDLGSKF